MKLNHLFIPEFERKYTYISRQIKSWIKEEFACLFFLLLLLLLLGVHTLLSCHELRLCTEIFFYYKRKTPQDSGSLLLLINIQLLLKSINTTTFNLSLQMFIYANNRTGNCKEAPPL